MLLLVADTKRHRYLQLNNVRNFGLVSPMWDVFIKPSPQGSQAIQKMKQKNYKKQKEWMTPIKQCILDAKEPMWAHRGCDRIHRVFTALSKRQSKNWNGEVDTSYNP